VRHSGERKSRDRRNAQRATANVPVLLARRQSLFPVVRSLLLVEIDRDGCSQHE
jgi:hypothetical protein